MLETVSPMAAHRSTPTPAHLDTIKYKQHDIFNLITIPFLILTLLKYFLTSQKNYFELYLIGLIYFIIDMIWLIIWPKSVTSPYFIIFHHILSCIGWSLPIIQPNLASWVALCFLVEFNTFFLIARRNVQEDSYLYHILTVCFHITWVILRLILYPLLVYHFFPIALSHSYDVGTFYNYYSLGLILVVTLTLLNLKWSYELYFIHMRKIKGGL